ncbi:MAG: hypothetical protein AAGD35_15900 [Actinomycetota bacterium]
MAIERSPRPRIRRLNAIEIDSYDVLPRELAERVRIIRVPFLFGPYSGMALGRFVLLKRDVADDGWSPLLFHELVHVRQWTELGVVGFGYRYIRQFLAGLVAERNWNDAYLAIEAEVEARRLTAEWYRRRNPLL